VLLNLKILEKFCNQVFQSCTFITPGIDPISWLALEGAAM